LGHKVASEIDPDDVDNFLNALRASAYPANLMGSKLVEIADIPLLFTLEVRYYAVNTNIGAGVTA
jgi:hypothetical protein